MLTPLGPLTVGQTNVPAQLGIINSSTDAEATLDVSIDQLTFVPSCGSQASGGADCPAPAVDPGVLRLSATGTGTGDCVGLNFTITQIDPTEGKYQFVPSAPLVLGPGPPLAGRLSPVCTINFAVDVVGVPSKDASGLSGLQTSQLFFVHGVATSGAGGGASGGQVVSVTGPPAAGGGTGPPSDVGPPLGVGGGPAPPPMPTPCIPAAAAGDELVLVPSSGTLPAEATATFTSRLATGHIVGRPGKKVTFAVDCGPNAGRSVTATTDRAGNATFTYRDSGGAGTDALSTSYVDATGATERATGTVTWVPPLHCGRIDLGLGFATALRCLAATPQVKTILQVGECGVGVISFFAPPIRLARLLGLVKTTISLKRLRKAAKTNGPIAKLVYDLYRAYGAKTNPKARRGFRSFMELTHTLEQVKNAGEFLQTLPDLWSALAKIDSHQIAFDVADLTGLKPCVELLGKVVA